MDKKLLTINAIILVIGLGIGYLLAPSTPSSYEQPKAASMNDVHRMPDGSLMQNHAATTPNMSDMMHDMNANLAGKTGDAFDQAFLEDMIIHHQGAVDMATAALRDAKHQEIKDLANAIISAQNKEIADMKSWLDTWYK